MSNRFTAFCQHIRQTLRCCPAEVCVSLIFALLAILAMAGMEWGEEFTVLLPLYPLFFFFSFLLGRGGEGCCCCVGAGRRIGLWVYRLSPVAVLPFFFVSQQGREVLEDWYFSSEYVIALILCALACTVVYWRRDNVRFVVGAVRLAYNLIVSWVLTGVAYGLTTAMYASVLYIFDLDFSDKVLGYWAIVMFLILMPLVFLALMRRARGEEEAEQGQQGQQGQEAEQGLRVSRFVRMLLNYVVTPALLAYTGVLYLYFLKIGASWSLPVGGLAWMIAAYASLAVLVAAVQPLLGLRQRIYDWFFGRLYLWSIPPLVMFWIGALYRVGQYGLTQWRVYMLICGVLMTVGIVMFVPGVGRRVGRYLYLSVLAIVLLSVFTYVPLLRAEDLEAWSQAGRGNDGGGADQEDAWRERDEIYLYYNVSAVDVRGFSTVVDNIRWDNVRQEYNYTDRGDTLTVRNYDRLLLQLDFDRLLTTQLHKVGWGADSTDYTRLEAYLEANKAEFLVYDADELRIHFESMHLVFKPQPKLSNINIDLMLVK